MSPTTTPTPASSGHWFTCTRCQKYGNFTWCFFSSRSEYVCAFATCYFELSDFPSTAVPCGLTFVSIFFSLPADYLHASSLRSSSHFSPRHAASALDLAALHRLCQT